VRKSRRSNIPLKDWNPTGARKQRDRTFLSNDRVAVGQRQSVVGELVDSECDTPTVYRHNRQLVYSARPVLTTQRARKALRRSGRAFQPSAATVVSRPAGQPRATRLKEYGCAHNDLGCHRGVRVLTHYFCQTASSSADVSAKVYLSLPDFVISWASFIGSAGDPTFLLAFYVVRCRQR